LTVEDKGEVYDVANIFPTACRATDEPTPNAAPSAMVRAKL